MAAPPHGMRRCGGLALEHAAVGGGEVFRGAEIAKPKKADHSDLGVVLDHGDAISRPLPRERDFGRIMAESKLEDDLQDQLAVGIFVDLLPAAEYFLVSGKLDARRRGRMREVELRMHY